MFCFVWCFKFRSMISANELSESRECPEFPVVHSGHWNVHYLGCSRITESLTNNELYYFAFLGGKLIDGPTKLIGIDLERVEARVRPLVLTGHLVFQLVM